MIELLLTIHIIGYLALICSDAVLSPEWSRLWVSFFYWILWPITLPMSVMLILKSEKLEKELARKYAPQTFKITKLGSQQTSLDAIMYRQTSRGWKLKISLSNSDKEMRDYIYSIDKTRKVFKAGEVSGIVFVDIDNINFVPVYKGNVEFEWNIEYFIGHKS